MHDRERWARLMGEPPAPAPKPEDFRDRFEVGFSGGTMHLSAFHLDLPDFLDQIPVPRDRFLSMRDYDRIRHEARRAGMTRERFIETILPTL